MNYMDYVDDKAMVMFTKGQVARMNAALEGPRKALTESNALTPIDTARMMLSDAEGHRFDVQTAAGTEYGDRAELVFDGVSWV